MPRKVLLAFLVLLSLALFYLGLAWPSPVFVRLPLGDRTTVFLSLFDGIIRAGLFTCPTRTRIHCETAITDVGSLPMIAFVGLNDIFPYHKVALGTRRVLWDQGMPFHEFYWKVPQPT